MKLNPAPATPPAGPSTARLAADNAGTLIADTPKLAGSQSGKPSWELRWALTGAGNGPAEPALGPVTAAAPVGKCVDRETSVAVPGGKAEAAIKVRERCGG